MSLPATIASLAGWWEGTNTLHDPNTGRPETTPSAVTAVAIIGKRFLRFGYTWVYQGQPQEGLLLLGFDPESNAVSGHWIDTWHMGNKVLACTGPAPIGTVSIRGSYAAPPGPDWGWRIELTAEGDQLRMVMTNIYPDGKEELAVESEYSRGG